ncbi:MAG TPA: serine/threonine-protein kinase [Anaeromyxobacteraceae bacterium]|nr:serine/threonine-protein kinase [Anaeromyxobacteraceae bacterium]
MADRLSPKPPAAGPGKEAEEELAPGACVGEYLITSLLARGGHGSVYAAEHRVLSRPAAVKVMHRRFASSAEMVGRFVREARVVNQIRHPAIVDIYDLGTLPDGRPYCVMELLHGQNLWQLLRQRGRVAPQEALSLLAPVCAALQAAHERGVVHRDVKASNVLVGPGDPPTVKLLDFGIAKIADPAEAGLTTAGERLGSTHSMAPEQIGAGAVDARTDVYALGILLYQLLTGRLPFHSEDAVELERLQLEAPPPLPSASAPVSPAVDAVVARALEKAPERRFPSAQAFLSALRAAATGEAAPAPEQERPALAVHVALPLGEAGDDPAALVALAAALDAAEEALRDAGLLVPLRTGDSLLAVLPLPLDPAGARSARAEVLLLSRSLATRMRAAAPHPAVRPHVNLHAGPARMRQGLGGADPVGGPLFRTAEWVVQTTGFHATAAALEGL